MAKEYTRVNGEYVGVAKYWSDNGNLGEEKIFTDTHVRCIEYSSKGKKWRDANYITNTGNLDGLFEEWVLSTGVKIIECTYKDGILHGLFQEWHKNGNKSREIMYENGVIIGESKKWSYDGELEDSDDKEYKPWSY